MSIEGILKTLNRADCIVVEAETRYVNELREDIEQTAREGREGEHDILINELIKEGKRLNKKPLQEYDHEEWIIGNLIRKKK